MSIMVAVVKMICDELTDLQLATLNICVETSQSPKNRLFDYEIVRSLFTENNGLGMHNATKEILAQVVLERLDRSE